jgi:serine/threonine-protein kinase/endoribonuclease IRE1
VCFFSRRPEREEEARLKQSNDDIVLRPERIDKKEEQKRIMRESGAKARKIGRRRRKIESRLALLLFLLFFASFLFSSSHFFLTRTRTSVVLAIEPRGGINADDTNNNAELSTIANDDAATTNEKKNGEQPLLVATLDGSVSAVDAKTGKFLWSFDTGSALVHASSSSSSSSSSGGDGGEDESGEGRGGDGARGSSSSSVFPGLDGSLYVARRGRSSSSAADIFSGAGSKTEFSISRLPVTTRDLVEASPSVTNDGAVIVGTRKTTVFAVDAESGEIVRTFDPETGDLDDDSALRGSENDEDGENGGRTIVLLGRTDYAVKSIDAVTGKVRWNVTHGDLRPVGGGGAGDNSDSNNVGYLGGSDARNGDKLQIGANNALSRVDESGNIVWTTRTSSMPLSVINERGENVLGTGSNSRNTDDGDGNNNNNEVTVGAHAGGYFALPNGGGVGDPVRDGSSGALVVPKYGESSALTNFVVGDNPTEDDWACMPMELKSIVEMQAEKGKIERSLLPGGKKKDEENDSSFGSKVTFTQFSFVAMAGTLVVVVGGTVMLKFLLQRQKVAPGANSSDAVNTNVGEQQQQQQQQPALTPSQKKKMKRKMKEQREKEMLEYAQNANESKSIIGFPEDGEASRSAMKVGRLLVKPTVLGYGSCGTVVFDGELDGRSVAVKRLLAQFHELARKELAALIASDEHPNILRCFAMEEDKDFVYVALERCETTLQARATETTTTGNTVPLLDTSGFPTSDGVRILRDVAAGLKQLHSQGIVHRDLKPSNILITEKGRGKLADMGVAKKVNLIDGTSFETRAILNNNNGGSGGGGGGDGTAGWQAPERLTNGRQSRAVDIFALGCIIHFVLTQGKHPFGEKFERDSRVLRGDYNLSALNHLPEAKDLVRKCLEANPEDRPSAREVLRHPAWWSREKRTQFLCDVSDRMELEDREPGERILLKTLERASKFAISNSDWRTKIDPAMLENLEKYRKYDGRSLRDLLRVIRNKSAHFRELPPRIQRILGEPPDAFYAYFASRFPNLLLAVHEFARKSDPIVNDQIFLKYFGDEEQLQEGNESWKDLKKLANDQKKESLASQNGNGSDDWDLPPQNFPVRPNAIDCEFYVKTGKCKYGETCKFNHPPGLHYRRV